jgi:hypothetical protein
MMLLCFKGRKTPPLHVDLKGCLVCGHTSPRHRRRRHGTVTFVAGGTSAVWGAAQSCGGLWPETKQPLTITNY